MNIINRLVHVAGFTTGYAQVKATALATKTVDSVKALPVVAGQAAAEFSKARDAALKG